MHTDGKTSGKMLSDARMRAPLMAPTLELTEGSQRCWRGSNRRRHEAVQVSVWVLVWVSAQISVQILVQISVFNLLTSVLLSDCFVQSLGRDCFDLWSAWGVSTIA